MYKISTTAYLSTEQANYAKLFIVTKVQTGIEYTGSVFAK